VCETKQKPIPQGLKSHFVESIYVGAEAPTPGGKHIFPQTLEHLLLSAQRFGQECSAA
jgi:hypothetical protein